MARTPTPLNHTKRRALLIGGVVAGSVAAAAAVVSTSSSAFTAATENANDSWIAGTLALTDDDSSTQMFNVAGMVPGQTETTCIEVTYTGTASSLNQIRLYSTLNNQTLDLASYLNLLVEQGSGGGFGDCSTFTPSGTLINGETMAAVTTTYIDYASGVGSYTPLSSGSTVSYRFTVALDAATPNSAQGGAADVSFTWEIQSA